MTGQSAIAIDESASRVSLSTTVCGGAAVASCMQIGSCELLTYPLLLVREKPPNRLVLAR